ncbi:MAG: 50S ribosomal protein L5 [Patescibacteria group bacterium]|nr:50S ribosomal protein L5 [Patescibacteria group bacterium]
MNTEEFIKSAREKIKKEFSLSNINAVPKLQKISVSARTGTFKDDPKGLELAREELGLITGQRPSARVSKKAISAFKLKGGETVGFLVTLRGKKMWAFLQKLTQAALPQVRDFRGIKSTSLDRQGNLSIGFRDQTAFPEIDPNKVDRARGLAVTITGSVSDSAKAKKFFECLGFVFLK